MTRQFYKSLLLALAATVFQLGVCPAEEVKQTMTQVFECAKIDKPYVHLPMKDDAPEVRLLVNIDGEFQHAIDVKLAQDKPDWNGTFSVQKWMGRKLTIVPEKPLAESGWIIENNVISHSRCVGVSLGRYGDEWDNKCDDGNDFNKYVERALANGWNKETIGHHLVRNNDISYCEQAGIIGGFGAVFSRITGNSIHDIYVQRLFRSFEFAGIKFHGSIDTEISRNHIYRTPRGIWLDWMAQGTRVTANLCHDNGFATPGGFDGDDIHCEVNHGPYLIDNNLFLTHQALQIRSQGGAYVHNLIAGRVEVNSFDSRMTPFHKAHSTEVAGLRDNPCGDVRFYNNVFVQPAGLGSYDETRLPVSMDGNVFLKGANSSKHEKDPLVNAAFDPALRLIEKADGFYLEFQSDKAWSTERTRKLVTTELLGKAVIPDLPFENPDGSPLRIDTDHFGRKRDAANPSAGPFETSRTDTHPIKVW